MLSPLLRAQVWPRPTLEVRQSPFVPLYLRRSNTRLGMTIHSWGAVTPGMTNIERQISCIKTCRPAFQRWKTTKVLVIDEGAPRSVYYLCVVCILTGLSVSMVDGQLFELLAMLADRLRKKTDNPFGGIQVRIILCHLVKCLI